MSAAVLKFIRPPVSFYFLALRRFDSVPFCSGELNGIAKSV
jgi:hypothetical protein